MYARSRDTSDKVLSADGMVRFPQVAKAEPTRREVTAKRQALIARDGQLNFRGLPCSPCADCGQVFLASSLRLTKLNPRMLCHRCYVETAPPKRGTP
jgi:hypothetical protein